MQQGIFGGTRKAVLGAGGIMIFVMQGNVACDQFKSSAILRLFWLFLPPVDLCIRVPFSTLLWEPLKIDFLF